MNDQDFTPLTFVSLNHRYDINLITKRLYNNEIVYFHVMVALNISWFNHKYVHVYQKILFLRYVHEFLLFQVIKVKLILVQYVHEFLFSKVIKVKLMLMCYVHEFFKVRKEKLIFL